MVECHNVSLAELVGTPFQVDGQARVYARIKVGGLAGWLLNIACAAVEQLDGELVSVTGPQVYFVDADGRRLRPVSPVYLKEGRERLAVIDSDGNLHPHMWLSDLAEAQQ